MLPWAPFRCSMQSSSDTASRRSTHPVTRILGYSSRYFWFRIDGVKVIPTNNPSGVMKRLTVWPHGSLLFFTSIRCPCDSSSSVAFSTLATSNSSQADHSGVNRFESDRLAYSATCKAQENLTRYLDDQTAAADNSRKTEAPVPIARRALEIGWFIIVGVRTNPIAPDNKFLNDFFARVECVRQDWSVR